MDNIMIEVPKGLENNLSIEILFTVARITVSTDSNTKMSLNLTHEEINNLFQSILEATKPNG
jgi:hypothetical protein